MAAQSRARENVELITDARTSPLVGWHRRRRLYLALQLARLPLFIISGLTWWLTNNHLWAVGIVLISLPLPWIAVLVANEPGDPDRDSRKVYKPGIVRENRRKLAELGTDQRSALAAGTLVVDDHGELQVPRPTQYIDADSHPNHPTSENTDPHDDY